MEAMGKGSVFIAFDPLHCTKTAKPGIESTGAKTVCSVLPDRLSTLYTSFFDGTRRSFLFKVVVFVMNFPIQTQICLKI